MMSYYYDERGWYTGEQLPGRDTDIEPPMLSETTTTGEMRANFTGRAWLTLPYFEPAPPPVPVIEVPQFVTMRQARLALLGAGLLDDIEAAINALPSPQKEAARIEWEYSQEVQRHNGFVSVLAPMLGLTAEQTDALFVQAATL